MSPRLRPLQLLAAALVAVAGLALPTTGWTWGAATHHYIAQNYSQHLPPFMDGLRSYDGTVDTHVTDPDTRKSSTPGESYLHYIDIDWYPEFALGTLSHDRATLEATYGPTTVRDNGLVPWAVGDVVATLTAQFQAQQWSAAALTIADLCHYVGDANQPLHCTQNYDGAMTGNSGIHSRYETTMMGYHIADLHTARMAVQYYPTPVNAMFDTIGVSWAAVTPIMQADAAAKAAAGGSYNTTYYTALWNSLQLMTRARIDAATRMTASMVYTAWVNAGEPAVPGSSAGVPPGAIAGLRLDAGPTPFRDQLTVRWAGAGPFDVDVFDLRGARVARLARGVSGAGSATWRGTGTGGRAVPGLYLVRLAGPGVSVVRRVTLLD